MAKWDRHSHCSTADTHTHTNTWPEPARCTLTHDTCSARRCFNTWHRRILVFLYSSTYHQRHGSLEGVGGLKTNEAYHSKADALVIPEMYFFNLPSPFFGNVGFVKFGTFSAVLAQPVMIREGYGQIVYETLPHILLSNASLVTKSCIARFVEGDAFNPSALNDCSTGPSPPLAHAKSTLSPS